MDDVHAEWKNCQLGGEWEHNLQRSFALDIIRSLNLEHSVGFSKFVGQFIYPHLLKEYVMYYLCLGNNLKGTFMILVLER